MHESDYRYVDKLPGLVGRLYDVVSELEELFPERRFTPDGHLVGSLGEVAAAYRYGLELLPASEERHDAVTRNGRLVQIKATQREQTSLGSEPDHLLVLLLKRDGSVVEVFNGPGKLAWDEAGPSQKNGQCSLRLSKLRTLMERVLEEERISVVNIW